MWIVLQAKSFHISSKKNKNENSLEGKQTKIPLWSFKHESACASLQTGLQLHEISDHWLMSRECDQTSVRNLWPHETSCSCREFINPTNTVQQSTERHLFAEDKFFLSLGENRGRRLHALSSGHLDFSFSAFDYVLLVMAVWKCFDSES